MNSGPVHIMGILNVTPDSFSDGGRFFSPGRSEAEVKLRRMPHEAMRPKKSRWPKATTFEKAEAKRRLINSAAEGRIIDAIIRAQEMVDEGASIIDVGGESTGPGSVDVSIEEELRRVIPVIEMVRKSIPQAKAKRRLINNAAEGRIINEVVISIDTYKARVARQAIEYGANMVNDVTALRGDPHMAPLIAKTGVPIVLMYAKDSTARTTREPVQYKDVMATIKDFLSRRIEYAFSQGIKREQIILDPGMGAFVSGDPKYSWEILNRLRELKELRFPILVGASRKSFLGGALKDRLEATLKADEMAIRNGASIVRVHDVAAHVALVRGGR